MDKVCVLFSGFQNLDGSTAINLSTRFQLKEYPETAYPNKKRYYADFDPTFRKDAKLSIHEDLATLFCWLGGNGIAYKINRAFMRDSIVDFQLYIKGGIK